MQLRPVIHSRLYREFLALDPKNYHGLIRFYEERAAAIEQLEDSEYHELVMAFVNALFEVGAYRQFLAEADQAIYIALDDSYRKSENRKQVIFQELLFRKSAAFVQVLQYEDAVNVLRQLLKINPQHQMARLLLRRALYRNDKQWKSPTRATAILLFGVSALIILVEVLVIRTFYQQYTPIVELSRNLIFATGLIVLGLGEVLTWWRAHRAARG